MLLWCSNECYSWPNQCLWFTHHFKNKFRQSIIQASEFCYKWYTRCREKEDKDSSSNNNNRQDNKSTLAPGTKITDQSSKAVYKITGKNTVEYVKCNVNKNKVSIPQKIMINGVSYQVTSIAAKAFKANKKIRSIVIPSTIRKIGKQAFLNCKNLKKITLKTSYLSKKAIGEKAFKGIHKKATIKVPKKQKKAYQKLLKSKGVGKKAKIK